jgi:hypothetical protein
MNMRRFKNLLLLKNTIRTWATLTEGIEWLIATQLAEEHGNGPKEFCCFLYLTILKITSFCTPATAKQTT